MTYQTWQTMAEAEQYAATKGIRLTASDRDNIRKNQESEQQRLSSLNQTQSTGNMPSIIEGFNDLYPRFLEALHGIGDVLLTFTQTVIISFGVPVVVVLLLIVEQQRVVHGILLFENDPALAVFAAWALVMLNLVLEFQIHYIEHREGFSAETNYRFSLRLWFQSIAYKLGVGNNWKEIPASPAQRYKSILRLVTFSILALALAGSMQVVIAETDGAWYSAVGRIFMESDLSIMMTWMGGLLFAAAAVLSAQGLSRYVAIRTVEILAMMEARRAEVAKDSSTALEAVAVQYVIAKVASIQSRQAEKDVPEVTSMPTPFLIRQDHSTTG